VKSAEKSAECGMLGAKRLADDAELNDAAYIFKRIAKDPVVEAKAIREALKRPDGPIMLTPEEAWAHMVLTDQTKDNYKMERALQIKKRGKIYPDYNIVRKKKPEWMPPAEDIWFAADGFQAIVPMQSSLNFQMKRLLDETLIKKMKVIKTVQPNVRFRLYVKCGADGSSGHVQYQNMDAIHQQAMHNSSMIVCQLKAEYGNESAVVWASRMLNSPYACIPLR
jgi:hypothetical protein